MRTTYQLDTNINFSLNIDSIGFRRDIIYISGVFIINPDQCQVSHFLTITVKDLNTLATYLRELRFAEGITQQELSQNLNLHRNTIIRAEN